METQSRRIEKHGKGPGRLVVAPGRGASRSEGGALGVRDPLLAASYMLVLLLALALLFAYILNEVPGLGASVWRAKVSPYHPANGPVLDVEWVRAGEPSPGVRSGIAGILEGRMGEERAHAHPRAIR